MSGKRVGSGWSPYLAGALAGLVLVGAFYAASTVTGKTGKSMETSSAYVYVAGTVERAVWPDHAEKTMSSDKNATQAIGSLLLACGLFFGALLGALSGRSFEKEDVPRTWVECIGVSPLKRGIFAFVGGVAVMFGVRLSGGGLIDHGLIGVMSLSLSGLIATLSFFFAGCLVARNLYKKGDLA